MTREDRGVSDALIPRRTAMVCLAGAVLVLGGSAAAGHASVGVGVAAGLLVGAGNPWLASRLLASGAPFALSSLFRLTLLTAVALGIGWVLGFSRVYLVIAGVAGAQLVLSGVALAAATASRRSPPAPVSAVPGDPGTP